MYARNLTASTPRSSAQLLPLGAFFGRSAVEREAASLLFAVRDADPDRIVERHVHEDAHFVLVLDGVYVSSARDADRVEGGPLLIYNPPGTTHRDRFAVRRGVLAGRFWTLSIPRDYDIDGSGEGLCENAPRALRHPLALVLAAQLARECTRWGIDSPMSAESLGLELLALAIRMPNASDGPAPSWLGRSIEQLHDRCTTGVTVRELAADAGVHPVHLARAFRRWVGCSPGDLLRRRRSERARGLLLATTRPLSQVAADCGYVDQSHLTRAVQRLTGHTPAALRALHRATPSTTANAAANATSHAIRMK